ncbi:hypothetical protein BG53_09865 [Paenibacillus darwinianus]|uniref:Bh protein n=1 Tax=Paenibacillus darwinianus TaxID=1380763 RepID=A0A9W5S2N0_9BACL|nr:hypothetical protein [Paenibacillus darwinianus]EXX86926.1 hypothetical protein CH50_06325 [Paenibacillus darwinianus]EXX90655.1 hypothetical protein BG52_13020 [Paenibacillus darwinianus]EXX91631.1 hypothetical protein BG53_09865 [Paenibacillus darwinianus]
MVEMTVDTFLLCDHCKDEVKHSITYLNNQISSVECKVCGKRLDIKVDISNEIYHELYTRIKTKPARMTEEYRGHLSEFIRSFPKRVVSKPFRIYREARKILGFYKKYH